MYSLQHLPVSNVTVLSVVIVLQSLDKGVYIQVNIIINMAIPSTILLLCTIILYTSQTSGGICITMGT
jgi:hypothetical protein